MDVWGWLSLVSRLIGWGEVWQRDVVGAGGRVVWGGWVLDVCMGGGAGGAEV